MSTQGHEKEAVNVEGLKAALKSSGNKAIYNEAICSTAGGTAAKVTNTVPPSFSLVSGAKILVKFTYAITVANATLQVGTNAAKPIFYHGAALAANLVKAGTSLLLSYDGTNFNIIGDINTDTTYQVMGASGANHASGLVPDTPSEAGTTKFLREDGTWTEPVSAGDGIDISNNEISADNTIARKTDLAPAKLGSGIGICSTSSGTALEVVLSDYNLVQNGIVAVTFANDVPANATLNINSKGAKPIYYKGAAIEADTIKADDTVMFCYDGTNYVVTSLGGGGSVAIVEYLSINLISNISTPDSALIGATVVVTDDDNSETILSTTWQGTTLECTIDVGINYTITVGDVTEYDTPSSRSFKARAGYTRTETFKYKLRAYVDLGLPSGRKWARGNIVSDGEGGYEIGEETAYGAYVSWGNVTPHFSSNGTTTDDGYKFQSDYSNTPGASITGSSTHGASYAANSGYDAARQILGGSWKMPTYDDFTELINNTTSVWTTKDGVSGREFTSTKNGAKIFFPAGGRVSDSVDGRGNFGFYWSSSLWGGDSSYYLSVASSDPSVNFNNRYFGFSVRAVV